MTKINLTCIMCPMGCSLEIEKNGKDLQVSGNSCVRGEVYAKEELTAPKRIVTTLVKLKDGGVLPVKTTKPIPKPMIFYIVAEVGKLVLNKGKMGDIIIRNVLNTGADVVITGNKVK